jgi:ribose-phosphate pyrophosphokinase
MKINKYPDGSSYISKVKTDAWSDNSDKIFKINSYKDLWHLNQYVDAYNNISKGLKPTIIIPNLIDAQADKRFADDQSSGLKLVCKFLNKMNANFKIFHPHNPEVVEALMDNVEIIDNSKFISNVLTSIITSGGMKDDAEIIDNLILMSSDAGGFKPLMKLCDQLEWGGQIHSCSKGRSYDGKKSELTQRIGKDDFFGKDILIVDDISVYGGTFKGLSKLLRQRNCGKLYLAVSHMTVQELGKDPVTNYFDKVFTSNSKFDRYFAFTERISNKVDIPVNLEIIKLF